MDLTYPEVGQTRPGAGGLPSGYGHLRRDARLGQGQAVFTAAVAALRTWRMQKVAGLGVRTEATTIDEGVEFATGLGVGPLRIWAPTRVVWLIDEPTRFGYGMGTLPGHPERGEESFIITLDGGAGVRFSLASFSVPVRWFARLGGPVTSLGQRYVVNRYIAAMRQLTATP